MVPQYAAEYNEAASQQNKLPAFLGALEDQACQHMHFQDLLEHCKSVNICVSKEQAAYGQQQTKGQAKCKTWTCLRTGRVTASKAYQVYHTNPSQPSLSLIHDICTPKASRKETASVRRSIKNEKKAQDMYVKRMIKQECHQDFRFDQCGFFINPLYPFFGASPHGMRYCACHGCVCIEVKCPATKASLTTDESCQDSTFCLEKTGDEIKLRTTHQYYMQVRCRYLLLTQISVILWCGQPRACLYIELNLTLTFGKRWCPRKDAALC